jgi:hypothetical protein
MARLGTCSMGRDFLLGILIPLWAQYKSYQQLATSPFRSGNVEPSAKLGQCGHPDNHPGLRAAVSPAH